MKPGRFATVCLVGGLLLAGAGFLIWHATRTGRLPRIAERESDTFLMASHPRPEELRAEIEDLKGELAAMNENDAVKQAVYQGMLAQAQKNLLANPLAMDWKDFYQASQAMRVSEETLIQNILARLVPEAGLSPEQSRDVLIILREERARTEAAFRDRHARRIEADMFSNLSEEESRKLVEEIFGIQKETRASFERRYQSLLREDQLRLVNLHLRNGFTCGYSTDGHVLGGIGVPDADFKALEQAH